MNCIYKNLGLAVIVSVGLFFFMSCKNNNSQKNVNDNIINVADIANFTCPEGLVLNPDVPFALLVDKEYKKNLPDTLNYEQYRPNVILLSSNLNLKDTARLGSFPSIVINLENPDNKSLLFLGDDTKKNILESIVGSVEGTSYKIDDWKLIDTFLTKDSINGFTVSYKQVNADKKSLNIDNTYLFPHGKMIRVTLTSPDATYDEWKKYYDAIVKSVTFTPRDSIK